MEVSHKSLIYISGLIWLIVGLSLLKLGLKILQDSDQSTWSLALLVALASAVGYLKGTFILGKSAKKGVERLLTFPNPTQFINIYSPKYYFLLAGMIILGLSMKHTGIPNDLRGLIDVAIGVALISGSLVYFRAARLTYGKESS